MAVTATTLIAGAGIGSVSSATTASVSPTGNRLQILIVTSRVSSGEPNTPTITGNGLTWVRIGGFWHSATYKLTVFRAMGDSPTTGTISIDFAAQTQTRVNWGLIEFAGVKTSGANGIHAIRQVKSQNTGSSTTSFTVTADNSFGYVNNATVGVVNLGTTSYPTVTNESGWNEPIDYNGGGTSGFQVQWIDSNDTTSTWSFSASRTGCGVIFELVEEAAPSGNLTITGAGTINRVISSSG